MAVKIETKEKVRLAMPNRKGRRKPDVRLITPNKPKQYRKHDQSTHVVENLTMTDTYKYGMGQLYFHRHGNAKARWDFKLRTKDVNISYLHDAINRELDHLCTLRYQQWELDGIHKVMPWIASDYIEHLEDFQLKRKYIHCEFDENENGGLKIWAEGPQQQVFWFEIYVLQIIQHLHFDDMDIDWDASKAELDKVIKLWKDAANRGIKFTVSDFGIRRSISHKWNEYMVETMLKELPGVFVGTSNVYLAIKLGCKAIGTFAHELYAVYQGIDDLPLHKCQAAVLEDWVKEFRGDLGIALSDNFGFNAFLRDFDKYFAKLYDGCRHDSGNPYTWGEMLIAHYKALGIDPATKIGCWSDSLDAQKAVEIAEHFNMRIKVAFGIGTFLCASLLRFKGNVTKKVLSMVMKVTRVKECEAAPWKWAVKLSDSLGKTMCPDMERIEEVKRAYHYKSIDEVLEVCQ